MLKYIEQFQSESKPNNEQSLFSAYPPEQYQVQSIKNAEYTSLFPDDLKYYDVVQGMTGDCWLLSTLSSLIHAGWHPSQIVSADADKDEYSVQFVVNGMRVAVKVSDDVLYYNQTANLVNARSQSKSKYVSLIEKAFALFNKSYEEIRSGNSNEAFKLLTGHKGFCLELAKLKTPELERVLLEHNGFPVTCASIHADPANFEVNQHGLANNHSYTIIKTLKLDKTYVVVRDQARVSTYSAESTNKNYSKIIEDLEKNNLFIENSGIMVFELKNFQKLFNSITYSDFKTNLHPVNLIGLKALESHTTNSWYDIYKINNTGSVFKLAVNLLNERLSRQFNISHPKNVYVRLALFTYADGKVKNIEKIVSVNDHERLTIQCNKEDVYAFVSYESDPKINFYMYGFTDDLNTQIKCEKLEADERDKMFKNMITHIAIKCTPHSDYTKVNNQKDIHKFHAKSTDSQLDIAYLYVQNNSKTTLVEGYTFKDMVNLEFVVGKPEGEFTLQPGEEFLAVFKRKKNGPWSWKYSFKPKSGSTGNTGGMGGMPMMGGPMGKGSANANAKAKGAKVKPVSNTLATAMNMGYGDL
eukprot:Mrub_02120.p1 GENE.Mrub_02120~~Mrub_02120.p1  ORF type:complete len:600 (-),score=155.10 Mrub_02120:35-1783(-)